MTDTLEKRWCCFTCNTTFPLGRMKLGVKTYGLRCPNCGNEDTHPAHGETIELDEYHGEIGTIQ